jgi:alkylation response protein AidB-like acyl-CoA dehydrogenase
MTIETILEAAPKLAREWAAQRDDRQQRTQGDPADYQQLSELGVPMMAVPVEFGGTWESQAQSARPICTMLRTLAAGDPSITLASAMHHLVLSSWRVPAAPEPWSQEWTKQRREVFKTVLDGGWWGTIISEPGSGGDTSLSRAQCVPEAPGSLKYRMTGKKHFGSGTGMTSFMTTRAVPQGDETPDLFFLETRNHPWDGSTGMKLAGAWRGHGMMSTNSHAFDFQDFPATRIACPSTQIEQLAGGVGLGSVVFTSVIVGVVDAAMDFTRRRLSQTRSQGSNLRAFQQVEWTLADQEHWVIDQLWESAMRAFDENTQDRRSNLLIKESVARLAESALSRLCKLSGGSSYTWYSPLGAWYEDVRALGYLRPPWPLAFDQMYDLTWTVDSEGKE